jgi:hypothetical protein
VAVQRQVGVLPLDGPLGRSDTDAELDLDAVDPGLAEGSVAGFQLGLRSRTTVSPGM